MTLTANYCNKAESDRLMKIVYDFHADKFDCSLDYHLRMALTCENILSDREIPDFIQAPLYNAVRNHIKTELLDEGRESKTFCEVFFDTRVFNDVERNIEYYGTRWGNSKRALFKERTTP